MCVELFSLFASYHPDLNLIDWSCNNHLAIALGGVLYLWNASSGDIQQLFEMEHESSFISAVSWIPDGKYLAIGTSDNEVQVGGLRNVMWGRLQGWGIP